MRVDNEQRIGTYRHPLISYLGGCFAWLGQGVKRKTTVAIIGGAAKKRYFPQNYKGQIWGINGGCGGKAVPGFSVMFNIHRFKLLKQYGYNFEAEKRMRQPIWTADAWPKGWLKDPAIFPAKAMSRVMPRGHYHCGSADWLVAFAIWISLNKNIPYRFTQIDLHGWNLIIEAGEPISARACLEYWCGYAEASGIKVNIAPDCNIFHYYHLVKSKRTYGYDDCPMFVDETRRGQPYDYRD